MNDVGIALVWCAVQVTLIGVLAAAIYTVARRIGPAAGSLVVTTSLLVIVALSALALSPWPHWPVALSAASSDRQSAQAQREAIPAITDGSDKEASARGAGSEQAAGPSDLPEANQATPAAAFWQALLDELSTASAESEAPQRQWTTIAAILFLLAVGAGFLWVLIGLVAVRSCRLRSRPVRDASLLELVELLGAELGCRRPIEVRQTRGLITATTFGWRRPIILLPAEWTNWTQAERRAVLAHEIAHVRHHDFVACLGGQLVLALHFYHPLVHWLAARLRLEQELAADATAATLAGGRESYLRTLAEIALRQEDRFVGWPARTFLPTRNTFLRRIQMLRHSKQHTASLSLPIRALMVGTLVLLGLIVAGLRSPARDPAALAGETPQANAAESVENTGLDLSCVSSEAVALASICPGEILRRPEFKELATFLNKEIEIEEQIGLPLEKIERVTWVSLTLEPSPRRPARALSPHEAFVSWLLPFDAGYLLVRTSEPKDSMRVAELIAKDQPQQRFGGHTYYLSPTTSSRGQLGYSRIDDRTIVIAAEPTLKLFLLERREGVPRIADQPTWRQIEKDPLIVAVDVRRFWERVPASARREIPPPVSAFAPLWENATTVALGLRLDGQLRIRGVATCQDEEGAKRWQETAQAATVLGRNAVGQARATLRASVDRPDMALVVSAMKTLDQFLGALRLRQEGRTVRLQTAAKLDAARMWLMADALNSARAAARRAQSRNNLKQIALAMHNLHDVHKRFPAAASYDADGKPLLSWRVQILPYLEQVHLYKQFHLDEPWDSPHNIKLLPKMPAVLRNPADTQPDKYSSSYYVLTGPDTVFAGKKGVGMAEIRDGTSNTIMVVEARRGVPWTKPEDIPYDPGKPLPKLGGFNKAGFDAALCDGSVRFFSPSIDERVLRALINKADGQAIDHRALQ